MSEELKRPSRDGRPKVVDSESMVSRLERLPSRHRKATDSFGLTFDDIMESKKYRAHVMSYFVELKDNTGINIMHFLDGVDSVNDTHKETLRAIEESLTQQSHSPEQTQRKTLVDDPMSPAARRRMIRRQSVTSSVATLRGTALTTYRKFIDPASPTHIPLNPEVLADIKARVERWPEKLEDISQAPVQEAEIVATFTKAKDTALAWVREHWRRFVTSDHYIELMLRRLDRADEQLGALKGQMDSDMNYAPGRGWINEDGFQSVHVDVMGARDLRSGTMGAKPDPYCIVTVDTTSYKTKTMSSTSSPKWAHEKDYHFEFPLSMTTQFVIISVYDQNKMRSDKHLGDVVISIEDAIQMLKELKDSAQAAQGANGGAPEPAPLHKDESEQDDLSQHEQEPVRYDEDKDDDDDDDDDDKEVTTVPRVSSAESIDAREHKDTLKGDKDKKPDAGAGAVEKKEENQPTSVDLAGGHAIWFIVRKPGDNKDEEKKNKQRGSLLVRITLSKEAPCKPNHPVVAYSKTSFIADLIRKKVSRKKRRHRKDGFDLDLSYITDRIIAMGFPSMNIEGVYRNNMQTVKAFFEKAHNNQYKVYNLCSERYYDPGNFDGKVVRYGFDDHNPCAFSLIDLFCEDVHEWLEEHPQHIAAIHCKAGKGRTGLMICCYMLYVQLFPHAASSLKYYATARTENKKGVTIPSQIRYVYYYDRYLKYQRMIIRSQSVIAMLNDADLPETMKKSKRDEMLEPLLLMPEMDVEEIKKEQQFAARTLGLRKLSQQNSIGDIPLDVKPGAIVPSDSKHDDLPMETEDYVRDKFRGPYYLPDEGKYGVYLTHVVLHGLPHAARNQGESLFFKLKNVDRDVSISSRDLNVLPRWDAEREILTFEFPAKKIELYGDVQIIFFNSTTFSKPKVFQIWLHTRFLIADGCEAVFKKGDLDKMCKDKKHKAAPENFQVDVRCEPVVSDRKKLFATLFHVDRQYRRIAAKVKEVPD